jgi:hypothetical protein
MIIFKRSKLSQGIILRTCFRRLPLRLRHDTDYPDLCFVFLLSNPRRLLIEYLKWGYEHFHIRLNLPSFSHLMLYFFRNTFILKFINKNYSGVSVGMFLQLPMASRPIRLAARSKAWTFLAHSNTEIVGSNPNQGMDVCVCVYSVCVRYRPCDGLIPRPRNPTDSLKLRN